MIVLSILDKWVLSFQPLFSRQAAFQWFVLVMFGFLLRTEGEGVTSVIRCLGLASNEYVNLLHFFHSSAFSIVPLCHHWRSLVFQYAPLVLVNNRPVYVVDAIKVGKTGKKMPGVKLLHQESEDNSKAQYIMGHFWGSLCLLCGSCERFAAIPLRLQLQDGLKRSPSEKATLPDKMLRLIRETAAVPGLVVADRYYTCRNVLRGLLDDDFHYIGPVRCSAVAYHPLPPPPPPGRRGRGRPRTKGDRVKLSELFDDLSVFDQARLCLYGKVQVVRFYLIDLLWQGLPVRFVLSVTEAGRRAIFLCTDRTLIAEVIIETYGHRFTIESGFKALVYRVFGFCYRFWLSAMKKREWGHGDQYLHRAGERHRAKVYRKVEAYERFVNLAAIAMGMLEMLSLTMSPSVWNLGSLYFRTSPVARRPSVLGVRLCLQGEVLRVFRKNEESPLLAKILAERDRAEPCEHPIRLVN